MKRKTCKTCQKLKPLDEFYRNKKMPDGRLSSCRSCVLPKLRAYRSDNLEKIQAYDRERGRRPDRRAQLYAAQRRLFAKDGKQAARQQLNYAIRKGRVERGPCEDCGASESEGHHEDYSKPLDVAWLCRRCHQRRHGAKV